MNPSSAAVIAAREGSLMGLVALRESEIFERLAPRLLVGAAAGALAALVLDVFVPGTWNELGFVAPVACALAAGWHAARGFTGALVAMSAGLGLLALGHLFPAHPTFALAVGGAAIGAGFIQLHSALQPKRPASSLTRATAIGASAFAHVAAHRTALALGDGAALAYALPWPIDALFIGLVIGTFLALGAVTLQLGPPLSAVEAVHASASTELTGEFLALARRTFDCYQKTTEVLARLHGAPSAQLARTLTLVTERALELARRAQAVDDDLGVGAESTLAERVEELQRLGAQASDPAAKHQFALAATTIEAQLAQLGQVRAARERVIARLHGQLALLERTRLSVLGLRSSDAERAAAELAHLAEGLDAVARELDAEAAALSELHSS